MLLRVLALSCLCSVSCLRSDLLENMSLEEKVGQLMMVHFHGETVNDEARILVQEVKVGGIIYYNWSNGLTSPEQVQTLSGALQELTKENRSSIPLLIAADQEGGIVARLQSGFTCFPGNMVLGETGYPNLAKAVAFAMGEELQAVGINMDLSPVVDVNSNPRNPVIGFRSFGDNPCSVIAFGEQSLSGFKQAQVIATLKHFPGYGDVTIDLHEDLPIIDKSKQDLEKVGLLPFAMLASSADAIMMAHTLVPALDAENCSTLSEKTLKYLREVIGFQGIIVTDSLVMNGVLNQCHSVDEASIMALNAGCDILLLGGRSLVGKDRKLELTPADIQRIHSSIVQAVKSGAVSEVKLNEAVKRILKLKERYLSQKIATTPPPDFHAPDLHEKVYTVEHRALAQKIASLVLKSSNSDKIVDLSDKKIFVVAPDLLRNRIDSTSLCEIGKTTNFYFFNSLNPSNSEIEAARKQVEFADVVIVCSYNASKNPTAIAMTECLLGEGKPLILLSLRDPLDGNLFSTTSIVFKSFSPTYTEVN